MTTIKDLLNAKYLRACLKAGYHMDKNGSIVPDDRDQDGFWEDWESCYDANNLGNN